VYPPTVPQHLPNIAETFKSVVQASDVAMAIGAKGNRMAQYAYVSLTVGLDRC